jgi:hypothetical protein
VFPVRYELNFCELFRRNSASKLLMLFRERTEVIDVIIDNMKIPPFLYF